MGSKTNIQVINKNPAKKRLRAIFANRYRQVEKRHKGQLINLYGILE